MPAHHSQEVGQIARRLAQDAVQLLASRGPEQLGAGFAVAAEQPLEHLLGSVHVPGHGPPMDRAAFGKWRGAFDALLACGASERPAGECVDGWVRDAGAMLEAGHEGLVRGLGEYYVGSHLRDAEKTAQLCGPA